MKRKNGAELIERKTDREKERKRKKERKKVKKSKKKMKKIYTANIAQNAPGLDMLKFAKHKNSKLKNCTMLTTTKTN